MISAAPAGAAARQASVAEAMQAKRSELEPRNLKRQTSGMVSPFPEMKIALRRTTGAAELFDCAPCKSAGQL
jgi:hypothetical protein